jgi:hypothetical protein
MDDILEQLHVDWMRINNVEIPIEVLNEIVYKRGLDNVRHTLTQNELKKDIRQNLDAFKALSTKEKIHAIEGGRYVYGSKRENPQFFDYCKDMYEMLRTMDVAADTPHPNFERTFEDLFNLISPELTQKAC